MENVCKLNFINDEDSFGTKYFPKDNHPLVAFTLGELINREEKTYFPKTGDIKYGFSSFEFPDFNNLFNSHRKDFTLIIAVDNSFDIIKEYKDYGYIFIDHHLYEQKIGSCPYNSNSSMIYENFTKIYKFIETVIRTKCIHEIGVLFHTDLDGIGSGLMISKILECIVNNNTSVGHQEIEDIGLALVLGEYGDISVDKEDELSKVFNPSKTSFSGLKKKFEIMSKNLGRYFKAVRPVIEYFSHYQGNISTVEQSNRAAKVKNSYDRLKLAYNVSYEDFKYSYFSLKEYFHSKKTINTFEIIRFISKITQDQTNVKIIDLVQKEINRYVESYIRPDTPQIDFTLKFNNVDGEPVYKILLIDSPMDIGRSVIWTYKGKVEYFKDDPDSKKFSLANYKTILPQLIMQCNNIGCYNIFSSKLSLHSFEDNSAFDIGKAFGGGGHANLSNGGSLGSVIVDFEVLKENTEIVSIL